MIEMLGVLAIIGVLSVGGLVVYRQAMINYRMTKLFDFVSKVRLYDKETCSFGENCQSFGGSSADGVRSSKSFCAWLNFEADYCAGSAWGGYRTFLAIPNMLWFIGASGGGVYATLFFRKIPMPICYKMIDMTWSNYSFLRISTPVDYPFVNGKIESKTDKATLKQLCEEKENDINFWCAFYYKR